MKAMADFGLPASVSDAGVGALCARTAVMGAHLNVKINAGSITDKTWMTDILAKGRQIEEQALVRERQILAEVDGKLGG